jgi:hypothetical protein
MHAHQIKTHAHQILEIHCIPSGHTFANASPSLLKYSSRPSGVSTCSGLHSGCIVGV